MEAPGRVAWLYYSRIHDLAQLLHLDVSLLGHVMAHEMGHLLLPYGAHAAAGLMKGDGTRDRRFSPPAAR